MLGMKGEDAGYAAAHRIPMYLAEHGYRILPVNPKLVEQGYPGAVARLADLEEVPDVVEVFRRSENIAQHVDELLDLHPGAVWLQQGIRDDAAAIRLREAGIQVVQDRCMYTVHRSLGDN